jgi:hypothetical protein
VGSFAANRYVPIRYTVRENGILRTVEDSVFLKPSEAFTYLLHY